MVRSPLIVGVVGLGLRFADHLDEGLERLETLVIDEVDAVQGLGTAVVVKEDGGPGDGRVGGGILVDLSVRIDEAGVGGLNRGGPGNVLDAAVQARGSLGVVKVGWCVEVAAQDDGDLVGVGELALDLGHDVQNLGSATGLRLALQDLVDGHVVKAEVVRAIRIVA